MNLLNVVNGSTRYEVESTFTTIHVNVSLPANLVCKHCVFQWKYVTGNSWGTSNGKACLGCGTKNEEFYGCSDIAIMQNKEIEAIVDDPKTKTITPKTTEIPRKCTLSVSFSRSFDLTALVTQYCHTICSNNCASEKDGGNFILYNSCKKSCEILCVCK